MIINEFINGISCGAFDEQFRILYGSSERALLRQKARYLSALEKFSGLYPESGEIKVFSAPGKTVIGGDHADNQCGRVIAAAVDIDIIAIVAFHDEGIIRVRSDESATDAISLDDLSVHDDEKGTSAAIIRRIAAKFARSGVSVGGFNAYISSDIIEGSGLSYLAAFEVLIGTIIDNHYNNGRMGAVEIAKIGQYAENAYFGKSGGFIDQAASSVGGCIYIDFENADEPKITPIKYDFNSSGYCICITKTNENGSGMNDEYSLISSEMKHIAKELGGEVLREIDEEDFYERLPELRTKFSGREILGAAHFFAENKRVESEKDSLECGDTESFFELVRESGESYAMLFQNIISCSDPEIQAITLAVMLSKRELNGCGAVKVNGGGFSETVQAFVPDYMTDTYIAEMERIFGGKCCMRVNVRPVGCVELKI